MDHNLIIRTIEQADNITLAKIIRDTLKEFNANKPGTVYFDERTDHLFEEFRIPGVFIMLLKKRRTYLAVQASTLQKNCLLVPANW